jgi:hypothetical protein
MSIRVATKKNFLLVLNVLLVLVYLKGLLFCFTGLHHQCHVETVGYHAPQISFFLDGMFINTIVKILDLTLGIVAGCIVFLGRRRLRAGWYLHLFCIAVFLISVLIDLKIFAQSAGTFG